ncbi:phosphopantetheinyl transferase [Solibacillus silvestris StLB046]|uniref:Phosphopantetheinyl transferase n=1 Tax=Solibacillus silvestris (strain StLB046) TaxID=1002809 RepID=F2F9X7_SOLSS|nr:phosphopantetheinyl transferase [Solibacillus silvestris StLB046]
MKEKRRIANGTAFSEVWTRKVAILKCTGEGIQEKMNEFSSYQTTNFTVTYIIYESLY